MANWNLSVELRGQGNDLVQSLRAASREANSLSRNVRQAQQRLDGLRDSARDASQSLGRLQRNLRQTADGLGDIHTQARSAATGIRSVTTAAGRADQRLEAMSTRIRGLRDDTDGLNGTLGGLGDGLRGLGGAARGAGAAASSAGSSWQEMAAKAAAVMAGISVGAPIAATAITTALPVAFAAVGAAALKSDAEVTQAFAGLRTSLTDTFVGAAQPLKTHLVDAMSQLSVAARELEAPLSRMFATAGPMLKPLVDGLIALVRNALPGIEAALGRAGPAMEAFGQALAKIGSGVSELFDRMTAGNEQQFADVWATLGDGIYDVLVAIGDALGDLTASESSIELIAGAFDALASAIRIVAFLVGSMTPLWSTAMNVLNTVLDIVVKVTDGFGTMWDAITGGKADAASTSTTLKGVGEAVAEAAKAFEQGDSTTRMFADAARSTGAALDAQKKSADALRESIIALNDVARGSLDAQAAMEQAIDDATEAAGKHNGALSMTNGKLNLGSQAARDAYKPLSDLAAKTNEAAAAARDNNASWSEVQGIYNQGRTAFINAAAAIGLTRAQAVALADQLIRPMNIKVDGANRAAMDLEMVQAKLRGTKSKTVSVKALTKEGQQALEELGFKIKRTKGKSVSITIPTGAPKDAIDTIQRAINSVTGKNVGIGVYKTEYYQKVLKPPKMIAKADGGIVEHYADGGMRGRERHVAQFARAGTYRVWAEDETGGEAYIPLAASKRPRSRAIAEETVRRLGGDPDSIAWYANGGLDFSYRSSGGQASKYTLSGLISASNDKKGKFSLSIFTSKLKASNNALSAWRKDLATVASRAGQDVADALADMGDDGIALTKKMAHGSSSYLKSMTKELEKLATAAKASLGEYTSQLKDAVKDRAAFQADLARLASMGYGDLAGRLAGQNDADAAAIAAQAARDPKKAATANSAAAAANKALDGEQLAQLVQIIAAVKSKSTGIHDVAAATGLGEDDIIAVASKAQAQISSSLGIRAARFLADLGRAEKGLAYADGGIRAGIYATQAGLVRFAEPETGGEAYIPLGANKRRGAMNVLGDVASRFGVGLGDAAGSRVVIVREKAPMVGATHFHIGDRKSDRDLARDIESRQTYQLRRLARGGAR